MRDEQADLSVRMSQLSNDDLLKIVDVDLLDYPWKRRFVMQRRN